MRELSPWRLLSNAIVEQACIDYAAAFRKKEEIEKKSALNPEIGGATNFKLKKCDDEMNQIERFIRSETFYLYCGFDAEHFIKLLKERGGKKHNRHVTYRDKTM